jgi:hypothetical protein
MVNKNPESRLDRWLSAWAAGSNVRPVRAGSRIILPAG